MGFKELVDAMLLVAAAAECLVAVVAITQPLVPMEGVVLHLAPAQTEAIQPEIMQGLVAVRQVAQGLSTAVVAGVLVALLFSGKEKT